jgi:hypothetical protein
MAEYQRPAIEIVMFKNNRKRHEKAPDETGVIKFNEPVTFNPGDELEVALWPRTSKQGNQFMSGIVQPKKDYQPQQRSAPQGRGRGGSNVVDIDF